MYDFQSREYPAATCRVAAAAVIAKAVCCGRTVTVTGAAPQRLAAHARVLGWNALGDGVFHIPSYLPLDERDRISSPHFLTFAAAIHRALHPS